MPAGGTSAAISASENFGTFSFYEQLSGKLRDLPMRVTYSDCELRASRGATIVHCPIPRIGFEDLLQLLTTVTA